MHFLWRFRELTQVCLPEPTQSNGPIGVDDGIATRNLELDKRQ
jgi:hypothetical protein